MKSVFSELQFPCKARADESIEGNKQYYSPSRQCKERGLAFRVSFLIVYDQSVNIIVIVVLLISFMKDQDIRL